MPTKQNESDLPDINMDEMTEGLSHLPSAQSDEQEEGKAEYIKVCKTLKLKQGELVYYKNICAFSVTNDKFKYFLGESSYGNDALKSILKSKENVDKLIKYTVANHALKSKPQLHKYCYITNATSQEDVGFRFRKDLEPYKDDFDKWTALASSMTSVFDPENHCYNCYVPLIRRISADNKTINHYLKMTFGDDIPAIMDWMALYAFENRYEISRPTLLLQGERGSGKNTFIEAMVSQIYSRVTSEVTFDNFTEFYDSKLVYVGEISKELHKPIQLWDFSKQISGQAISVANNKYGSKSNVVNGVFFVMMTNEPKPFHIKDPITNPDDNQMLVVRMDRSDITDEAVKKFKIDLNKKGYLTIAEFFADNLGHWVYTDLFTHYKDLRKRIKNRPCRYGMPVPITKSLIDIMQLSISGNEAGMMKCIEDLFYQNSMHYGLSDEEEQMFKMFSAGTASGLKGFLPASIIGKMSKIDRFDINSFNWFLRKNKWIALQSVMINPFSDELGNNRSRTGVVLNYNEIAKFISDREADSERQLKEYKANAKHKGNFTSAKYYGSNQPVEPSLPEIRNAKDEIEELESLL